MSGGQFTKFSTLFLRLALSAAFLLSVADRFGLRGSFGHPNVFWGDFQHFVEYTAKVNSFLPRSVIPMLAWLDTFAEAVFGLGLIMGLYQRFMAIGSGILLFLIATALTISMGIHIALAWSVFSASAGSFLLAAVHCEWCSFDALMRRKVGYPVK